MKRDTTRLYVVKEERASVELWWRDRNGWFRVTDGRNKVRAL